MNDELNRKLRQDHQLLSEGDPLRVRVTMLLEQLTDLDSTVDHLEGKLGQVLKPEAPSPALHGEEKPAESELASFFQDGTQRLRQVTRRLAELTERVDL